MDSHSPHRAFCQETEVTCIGLIWEITGNDDQGTPFEERKDIMSQSHQKNLVPDPCSTKRSALVNEISETDLSETSAIVALPSVRVATKSKKEVLYQSYQNNLVPDPCCTKRSSIVNEISETDLSENSASVALPSVRVAMKSKNIHCVACERVATTTFCYKCSRQLRSSLQESLEMTLGSGQFCYCLDCQCLISGSHAVHKEKCIPLGTFKGHKVAWVSSKQNWASIFSGIQGDFHWDTINGSPYLLAAPSGQRCECCSDIVAPSDSLYGVFSRFCTINCWLQSIGRNEEYGWVHKLLDIPFDRFSQPHLDAFCIDCAVAYNSVEEGANHAYSKAHQSIKITSDAFGACTVEISRSHFMALPWICIKDCSEDFGAGNHLFRLRDNRTVRCRRCELRLDNGGGCYCSLDCWLYTPLIPRQLELSSLSHKTDIEGSRLSEIKEEDAPEAVAVDTKSWNAPEAAPTL